MLRKSKRKNSSDNFLPYSKKLLEYSRIECWIMTAALFIMRALGIETGELYQICLAGWAGYGVAKALYYNMAKSDHQIQLLKKVDVKNGEKVRKIISDDLENRFKETISEEIESKEIE